MILTLLIVCTLKMLEFDANVSAIHPLLFLQFSPINMIGRKNQINVIPFIACNNGEIRLEGGSSLYDGRVEVCRNQQWGGICDNMWSSVDATVVCRHLGFSGFSK